MIKDGDGVSEIVPCRQRHGWNTSNNHLEGSVEILKNIYPNIILNKILRILHYLINIYYMWTHVKIAFVDSVTTGEDNP